MPKRTPIPDRVEAKHIPEPNTGCWLWLGKIDMWGYGVLRVPGKKNARAHRLSYELNKGPIPTGLQIDHLCRNRACINPAHLEAVTELENIRRSNNMAARNAKKTHCPSGHPYDDANTYRWRNGRACRACRVARERRRRTAA